MQGIGLNCGVYASYSWLCDLIDWRSLGCSVWNAEWGGSDDIKGYMWQFTEKLYIGGRQFDGKNAYRIFKRDRFNHASPNSAQTESVCAGALRVQLAGDAVYFGRLVKKKYIGDGLREIEYEDIKRANRLMYITAFLCELLSVAVMSLVLVLL